MANMPSILLSLILLLGTPISAKQQGITLDQLFATYSIGHRFGGSSLTLEPDGRYHIESGDCTTDYFDSGIYTFSDGVLHFTILKQSAKSRGGDKEINLLDPDERKEIYGNNAQGETQREFKLLPIKWSSRVYLIYEDDLDDFANAVNLGLEPRSQLSAEHYYGRFFLRKGDEQKEATGGPMLPGKWLSVLLNEPVAATIVSMEIEGQERTATINKGSKEGLRIGMRLLAKDDEPSHWSGAEVVAVKKRSAKVKVFSELKVGDSLSTRYKKRDIGR